MWVPSPMGAWKRVSAKPFPLVISCWSSDVSNASPDHLSLSVCFDSSRSAAKTLNVPVDTLPWLRLELTFFKLLPKKTELGTEAPEPEPDPCKLNCTTNTKTSSIQQVDDRNHLHAILKSIQVCEQIPLKTVPVLC